MNMNKKFLKHYMGTEPEGTSKKYIFLVDNQDIAMNIVMSGYQALYLGQEDDEYYFSVNSFIEDMRSIQFHGTCQSAYHYVAACTTKWMNDRILEFCKEAGLDGKAGWQLFKEKEYLGKLDNQPEVGKALEQFIFIFFGNANSCICNYEEQLYLILDLGILGNFNSNITLCCKFHSIGNQIV